MLIGQRIRLRLAASEDADLLASWLSDPAVLGEFFNVWPQSRATAEAFIAAHSGHRAGLFVVTEREGTEPLGFAAYSHPFPGDHADVYRAWDLMWIIHPNHRGRGIASQVARLLVNHLFLATPVERIQATADTPNTASRRVAVAAGMTEEGVMRAVAYLNGKWCDLALYSILRSEWVDEATYRARVGEF
jgi:RimJ/RimL family protein N-acetyltransferase